MTPEEALAALAEENSKRRTQRGVLHGVFIGGFGALLLLMILVAIVKRQPFEFEDISSFASLVALIGAGAAFSARHREALEAAKQFDDPRLVGFLLEARATSVEKDVTEACEIALERSLPLLEDPDQLDDYHRGLLYKLPNLRSPKKLAGLALISIGRIAGPEAIPQLERFQASARDSKDPEWRRLGENALQILPDVRMRAARKIIEARTTQAKAEQSQEKARLALGE